MADDFSLISDFICSHCQNSKFARNCKATCQLKLAIMLRLNLSKGETIAIAYKHAFQESNHALSNIQNEYDKKVNKDNRYVLTGSARK